MLDRRYYEIQNWFEWRLSGQEPVVRLHGTPGYGCTILAGVTLRLRGK